MKKSTEENKFFQAGSACVDIFNDYSEDEVIDLPPSVIFAWKVGQELTEIMKGDQNG